MFYPYEEPFARFMFVITIMNYSTYTIKLNNLEKFIRNGWIKTAKDITKKLDVSERTASRLIHQLKKSGVKLKYSAKEKCYKIF